jgi:nucleotide-binding universal stress UspA family protein
MFTNIVVAVDGSKPSKNAINVACDIAQHYGSKIHLVHTPQVDTMAIAVGASAVAVKASLDAISDAGKSVMAAAKTQATENGFPPESTTIGHGDPATEVLTVLDKTSADLVVCGRRGLGNLSALMLGSTSRAIAHDADCAVLTVK